MFTKKAFPFFIAVLFFSGISLFSNPFMGSGREETKPKVRPPSSQGFMIEKQMEFREEIGSLLSDLKNSSNITLLWSMLGLSFLFGLLHAAGPGHRKTVVFTMFLSRKAKWYEPFAAAFLSSSAHAGSALLLILLFQIVLKNLSPDNIAKTSQYLEGITFSLLVLISLIFLSLAIRRLIKSESHTHRHIGGKGLYGTLLLSSFFPCPGVIMILTFSISLGVLGFGILAVLALSLGMGVTISFVGILAVSGRESLFLVLKGKEHVIEKLSTLLEVGSFLFLFLFSLWMVYPFIHGLIG